VNKDDYDYLYELALQCSQKDLRVNDFDKKLSYRRHTRATLCFSWNVFLLLLYE